MPFFTVWLDIVDIEPGICQVFGSLNSQDMIPCMVTTGSLNMTWFGSLNSQNIISQVNIYVMNTIWILCDVFMPGCQTLYVEGHMVL